MKTYTAEELVKFEEDIADCFNNKQIRAPVHLYSGVEEQMIHYFENNVNEEDWCLCSWRSHYQCLLKGVPKEELKEAILNGKSISLSFPKYRVLSSAIVTGSLPIAVGIALSIKRRNGKNKVHAFLGDMTSQTGMFNECYRYSINFDLPINFIIEDNNKSVCTDTRKTWGLTGDLDFPQNTSKLSVIRYTSKYPHAGAGSRIQF